MTHTVKELSKIIMNCNDYDDLLQTTMIINDNNTDYSYLEIADIDNRINRKMGLIEMATKT